MRNAIQVVGWVTFFGAGVVMWIGYLSSLIHWAGVILGILLAIFLAPGAVLFPAIYWVVEGAFPVWYFSAWGIGLLGSIAAFLASDWEKDGLR